MASSLHSVRCGLSVLYALGFYCWHPECSNAASASNLQFSTIDQIADQLVANDSYYGRSRLALASGGIELMDFSADQSSIRDSNDPVTRSLECLIRAKAIRRDFQRAFPEASFWVEPLDQIRNIIERLDENSYESASEQLKSSMETVDELLRSLERSTNEFARVHGIVTKNSREPATPFNVTIQIDPPRASIGVMPLLSYLRFKLFSQPVDDKWTDLREGKQQLIGKYRYRADWPQELGGSYEGTFEVKRDDVITFKPPKR